MEENLSSLGLSDSKSFTPNEYQTLMSLGLGVSVCSKSIFDLAKEIGFVSAARSFMIRYRYIFKLWRLREIRIMLILCENYESVPAWTISKVCAGLLKAFPRLRNFLNKRASVIRQSLIVNPCKGLTINNNSNNNE